MFFFLCKGLVTVTATGKLLPTVDYLVSSKTTTICKGLITVTTSVMLLSSVDSIMIYKIISFFNYLCCSNCNCNAFLPCGFSHEL